MKKAIKSINKGNTILWGIGIGAVVAIIISVLLTAGLTGLVMNGKIGEDTASKCIFLIRTIAILFGGVIGTGLGKEKATITIGLIAAVYLLIHIGAAVILFGGTFDRLGTGVLSVLLGSAVAVLIRLKPRNKRRIAVR